MASIKFTDSNSEKGKRIRLLIHFVNVIVVTFVYILLVHRVGVELGVDVNKPLREYEKINGFYRACFNVIDSSYPIWNLF